MEEDRRTRRALEELADLFLTDSSVNADRSHPDDPQHAADAAAEPFASASLGDTARDQDRTDPTDRPDDELVGPEPVRLGPKLPHVGAHSRPIHAYDHTQGHAANSFSYDSEEDSGSPSAAGEANNFSDGDEGDEAQPRLRLHRDDSSAANAPASIDPLDAAVRAAIQRGQSHTDVQGGSTATLDHEEPRRTDTTRPTATAEAVLLGNLPGLSGPWLTQYGQLLAQQLGPVAMLHVDDQRIDVELIEPTDRPQSAGRVPPHRQEQSLIERLNALMQPGPAQVQAVRIHTEASNRPAAFDRLNALDRWTILCGADDAAIMGAHQLLESLVATDAAVSQKHIGIMVAGSVPQTGQAAAERLSAQTRSLLGQPVEFVGCQRQMVPVNLRQIGRFGPTEALWPQLVQWLDQLDQERSPLAEAQPVSETDTPVNGPDIEPLMSPDPEPADFAAAAAETEAEAGTGAATNASQGSPMTDSASPSDWSWLREAGQAAGAAPSPASAGHHADADVRQQQQPSHSHRDANASAQPHMPNNDSAHADPNESADRSAADSQEEPNLATFLTTESGAIAGGVALEARCPQQPRTQLVLDQEGRLHLLRRHDSADDGRPGSFDGLRAAIVDLMEARRWVNQHLELLQLTQRQCQFDRQAEPVLHLFTDRADLATAMAARLGEMLRLHLLKQVRVGSQSTWFCTPLY